MSNISLSDTHPATGRPSLGDGVLAAPENRNLIYEDEAIRVVSISIVPGSIEKPDHHRLASVFVVGFYEVLSAASLEGASAACAPDPDVTTLLESGAEVAVGWPDVLESWKDAPFTSFAEQSSIRTKLATKVHASIARVAGRKVRGKMKNGESIAFSALGINIHEAGGDKWLIVHRDATKPPSIR
jgi:hypothetical protein